MDHERNGSSRSQRQILERIRLNGPLTVRQMREATGLSHVAVTAGVAALQDRGIIHGNSTRPPDGLGRPSTLWTLRPDAAYVVGIDVGAQSIRATLLDMAGQSVYSERGETAALLARAPHGARVSEELAGLVRRTVAASPLPHVRPVAAGVAISGLVDAVHGICYSCANIPGWRDLHIGADMAGLLGIDVLADDSACAQSLAEERFGTARGSRDFLFVNVGVGIGAALYMDGRLYRGPGGLAGELGHITVDESGPLCGCGNHGCAEALVGAPAIVRRACALLAAHTYPSLISADAEAASLTVEQFAAAAAQGDKLAFRVLNDAGEHLGVAIAAALNLLGAPLVVLGGGVARTGEPFLSAVRRTVLLRALPPVARQVRIVPSSLGDDAAARGAGLAALDRYLSAVV